MWVWKIRSEKCRSNSAFISSKLSKLSFKEPVFCYNLHTYPTYKFVHLPDRPRPQPPPVLPPLQLKEFINDTEDYINAELDQHRNQLIQFKVILGTASTVLALFLCLLGCFSMNIPSFIYDSPTQEQFTNFVWSLVGITGFLFLCLLLYLRWRGFIGV